MLFRFLTSQQTLFAVPLRWPLQGLLVGSLLRWWLYCPRANLAALPVWRGLHPWLPELLVAVVLWFLSREVAAAWQPLAWVLLALGLLTPGAQRLLTRRIQLWSMLLYGLSIASVMSAPAAADPLALALQLAYAVLAQWGLDLEVLPAPPGLAGMARLWELLRQIGRHRDRWLCYPLFVVLVVALPQRFAAIPLTLLLVAVVVLIYGFSVLLRKQEFRFVALGLLGVCLVRLVGVDLANADLILRGAVFVGVGLLMLALNALHERFGADR